MKRSTKMTSIRLDLKLADDAVKVLGAKSRSEAVHIALKEVVALRIPQSHPPSRKTISTASSTGEI